MWLQILATVCLVWYIIIAIVCTIGYCQLCRHFSSVPATAVSETLPESECPHITIIRPIKGLEPNLYECLASTFYQRYPTSKLTIYFCIANRNEPSLPILEKLLQNFPGRDVNILVEEEDPMLRDDPHSLGPNPKIRNMSRAYREAKGDLVWIIDCNVWVGKGVCGRLVDRLCGYGQDGFAKPYKFVHHLPIAVDMTGSSGLDEGHALLKDTPHASSDSSSSSNSKFGARLEELFLSSSHAKFYTAINTVVIAPCIVGKSNMFRQSHLNYLTSNKGIDYFSENICEDHLIGDLLWKGAVPRQLLPPQCQAEYGTNPQYTIGNHALCFGDLAIQPLANMSVSSYIARRVRWLRVRKFTVTLATLVEPGTESFLCSAYGAFALTNLPWLYEALSLSPTWITAILFWLFSVSFWASVDFTVYLLLHSARSVEVDAHTPFFAQPPCHHFAFGFHIRRPFLQWFRAWLGREVLALPIWTWAVWGGATVVWRARKFWVGTDMKVHEIVDTGENDERAHLLSKSSSVLGREVSSRSSNRESTVIDGKIRQD